MPRPFSYVLPIRATHAVNDEVLAYLRWMSTLGEVIVVDGAEPNVFAQNHAMLEHFVTHLPPAPELVTPMGKVGGVLTGVRVATHEKLVIADDDVRYDAHSLAQVLHALDDAHVVRPQNYFVPAPWHAQWDTGRTLLNRISGGDWPGTLGVRRSMMQRTNGYDGRAMFENLELVRTVVAAGGHERVLLDAFVARRPSTVQHFFSQRVRQAYDEFARPARLAFQLALLPVGVGAVLVGGVAALVAIVVVVILLAEIGRQRAGGARFFSFVASLCAPLWLMERAICSWLAVGSRIVFGGVRYRGRILHHAATSMRELRRRYGSLPAAENRQTGAPRRSA